MDGVQEYHAIGIMSGSSLDGLDIAYCRFQLKDQEWSFEILASKTIDLPADIYKKLAFASDFDEELDKEFGKFIGNAINDFIAEFEIEKPKLISSHGHTVQHEPKNGITVQLGSGALINEITGIKVVADLRKKDVELGGQGAPIVPIADRLLFKDYDALINLGGIANISVKQGDDIIGYDIGYFNQVLNRLASPEPFDKDGGMAEEGKLVTEMSDALNWEYYQMPPPKSLDNAGVIERMKIINGYNASREDKLHTYVEHIAMVIGTELEKHEAERVLITGGGARNTYFIERIRSYSNAKIEVADDLLIDQKEALAMAFFGVLRIRNEINCLASVTGASSDSSGGVVYG